ncbi:MULTISPECIES: lipase family protein [Bacillus]|uniref:lipase family protein n=1 Tax=Bacillus TaxID=1386 RepID=UPI000BB9B417|nr:MULTISPECIES: lipase family protein [Bacillus]
MRSIPYHSPEWALFLAECSRLAYDQFHQNGLFTVPKGFNIVKEFKAKSFHHLEWFGFILESDDAIIIAFRGTSTDLDWVSDAEIYQHPFQHCKSKPFVHSGFLSVYESARDEILETLKSLPKEKALFITGHSLGGALAVLNAFDIGSNQLHDHFYMYNYGAPRVGDEQFVEEYKKVCPASIRYVNLLDAVPFLPTTKLYGPISKKTWYYRHVPKAIHFIRREGSIVKNHSIDTYIETIEKEVSDKRDNTNEIIIY